MLASDSHDTGKIINGGIPLRSRRRIKLAFTIVALVSLSSLYFLGQSSNFSSVRSKIWPTDIIPGVFGPARNATWDARALEVKHAFQRGYRQYEKIAFPNDELRPMFNGSINNFNFWGVTAIDSIDTMILMGLDDEYQRAKDHVSYTDFSYTKADGVPFFETVIRYLGGLLSAYHLTQDQIFLSAADQVGKGLLPAFDTQSRLPSFAVDWVRHIPKDGWLPGQINLAEMASCQLEYKYLAHLTHRSDYFTKPDYVTRFLQMRQGRDGLWTTLWEQRTGLPSNSLFTVGSGADSTYEYLLKGYLLSGRTEKRLLKMHLIAAREAIYKLVFLSRTRQLMYITEVDGDSPRGNMQHLSCFFPGVLALGNYLLDDSEISPSDRELFQWAAEGLAYTCWVLYADQITGLGPEEVRFHPYNGDDNYETGRWMRHLERWKGKGRKGGVPPGLKQPPPVPGKKHKQKDYDYVNGAYLLRPETIETMYLMWRTTGDSVWRERAWTMFESIQQNTTVAGGAFASRQYVDLEDRLFRDETPSYFFAETLKYAYLAFLEEDPWPLDKIVFNTEAHPLPIFTWTDTEISDYNIV